MDLTQVMAREKGLSVDSKGFEKEMALQKKRAKSSEKFKSKSTEINWTVVKDVSNSKFKGYESTFLSADIVKYSSNKNEHYFFLNQTFVNSFFCGGPESSESCNIRNTELKNNFGLFKYSIHLLLVKGKK